MQKIKIIFITALVIVTQSFSAFAKTPQTDDDYMRMAIKMAERNPSAPFGAVIVDNSTGEVIAEGVNAVASSHNPTLHGEMVAINDAVKKNKNINWKNTTLYTTAEPCPMCQGAIIWAGIPHVVYGSSITFLKATGWLAIDLTGTELNKKADFYRGDVKCGVLATETNKLFAKAMEQKS